MPELSVEKLVMFLFTVVPGIVATQVYALRCPSVKREWNNSLFDIVVYGAASFLLFGWAIVGVVSGPYDFRHCLQVLCAGAIICFVIPTAFALIWYKLREGKLHEKYKFDHPIQGCWEFMLRKRGITNCCIKFYWKDGKITGGYMGPDSYAATFPQEPAVYVEQLLGVGESGKFKKLKDNNLGAVIKLSDCERVELFSIEALEEVEDEQEGKGN